MFPHFFHPQKIGFVKFRLWEKQNRSLQKNQLNF